QRVRNAVLALRTHRKTRLVRQLHNCVSSPPGFPLRGILRPPPLSLATTVVNPRRQTTAAAILPRALYAERPQPPPTRGPSASKLLDVTGPGGGACPRPWPPG